MFCNGFKFVINIIILIVICWVVNIYDVRLIVAADSSYDIAARETQKLNKAVEDLKEGFEGYRQGVQKSTKEFYAVKSELETLEKKGTFDSLTGTQQAIYKVRALNAIGGLIKAYTDNYKGMLNGMENLQRTMGGAVASSLDIQGAMNDEIALNRLRIQKASKKIQDYRRETQKTIDQSEDCQAQDFKSLECQKVKREFAKIVRKKKSLARTLKFKIQQKKMVELNKKITDAFNDQLKCGDDMAISFLDWASINSQYKQFVENFSKMSPDTLKGDGGFELSLHKLDKFWQNGITQGDDLIAVMDMLTDFQSGGEEFAKVELDGMSLYEKNAAIDKFTDDMLGKQ